MKKHVLVIGLSLISFAQASAHAADPAQNCVKIDDEIKFSGKEVYFSGGHLTAGKLAVSKLNAIDPNAAATIRTDGIDHLKDDGTSLAVGKVQLSQADNLNGSPLYQNSLIPTYATVAVRVKGHDGSDEADISGSIKLKPTALTRIKYNWILANHTEEPLQVCAVGMQLYLDTNKGKISSNQGGIVLTIRGKNSELLVPLQALNENHEEKAQAARLQMADASDALPEESGNAN